MDVMDVVFSSFGETICNMFGCVPVVPASVYRCFFHMFCLCFCMSEVISPFRSLRTGSQVFALLVFFV